MRIGGGSEGATSLEESQTEMIITNMWGKMKALESKYIDLANFYKQELVTTQA